MMRRSLLLLFLFVIPIVACGGPPPNVGAFDSLASLRSDGKGSNDGEAVGRWALGEMIMPGGVS
ncbi:MAG: hypothetical protein ACRELY_00210 [Polyangiaceae bacterium]